MLLQKTDLQPELVFPNPTVITIKERYVFSPAPLQGMEEIFHHAQVYLVMCGKDLIRVGGRIFSDDFSGTVGRRILANDYFDTEGRILEDPGED